MISLKKISIQRKMKKKSSDVHSDEKVRRLEKFNVSMWSLVVLFIGVLMLVLLHCYELGEFSRLAVYTSSVNIPDDNSLRQLPDPYVNIIQPLVYNVAVIIIVLAVGTMLFELFGYLQYYRKRIAEVFTNMELVNILDIEYKKKLKSNLLFSIYKPDTSDGQDIVNLFDNQISNIMETYYYGYQDTFIKCSCVHCNNTDKDYIKKEITREIEFKEINSSKHNFYDDIMTMFYKEMEKNCSYKAFELNSVEINGHPITNKDYDEKEYDIDGPYSKYVEYKLKVAKEIKKSLVVKLKYTTVVPIEDCFYSARISQLCKNMRYRVSFSPKEFEVLVNAFKFSMESSTDFKCEHYDGLTEASSNGWVLPGEGLTFTFFKK